MTEVANVYVNLNKNVVKVAVNAVSGSIVGTDTVTLRNTPTLLGQSQQAPTLEELSDVDTTNEADGYTLVYDASTDQWVARELTISDVSGIIDGGTF